MTVLLSQAGGGSRNAVAALAAAIDARDNYTLSHSRTWWTWPAPWPSASGSPARRSRKVRDGAMLHDVGKVAIPNEILYKPGPLDDAEWEVMRQHPVIGERILLRTPELAADRPAGAPRARALGRARVSGRAGRPTTSRRAAASSSPATRTTR